MSKKRNLIFGIIISSILVGKVQAFPSVCSMVNAASFSSCMNFDVQGDMCGWPFPRPCARISYYIPTTYIEVVSNGKESFFHKMPGAKVQLKGIKEAIPFASEDNFGTYSFHVHTTTVPYSKMAFSYLPCGGTSYDLFCFSSMSEHLGANWKTGLADKFQPAFLAWSASPKACLLKGAATSMSGNPNGSHYPSYNSCSMDRSWLKRYPPSTYPVCNGWGIAYPRYGTYHGSDQTTASLMIASRMKSLGNEVFNSVPPFSSEKWQMIYPQGSSCFKEGQNIGVLRAKRVSELGRLRGRTKNYLYGLWKRVSCKVDWAVVPSLYAGLSFTKAICKGMK